MTTYVVLDFSTLMIYGLAAEKIAKWLKGNPKLLNGSDGSAVAKVLAFTEFLTTNFDLPITLVDERLSTVTAAKKLRESGIDAKGAKGLIDAAAAVAILEQGLANEVR